MDARALVVSMPSILIEVDVRGLTIRVHGKDHCSRCRTCELLKTTGAIPGTVSAAIGSCYPLLSGRLVIWRASMVVEISARSSEAEGGPP